MKEAEKLKEMMPDEESQDQNGKNRISGTICLKLTMAYVNGQGSILALANLLNAS